MGRAMGRGTVMTSWLGLVEGASQVYSDRLLTAGLLSQGCTQLLQLITLLLTLTVG